MHFSLCSTRYRNSLGNAIAIVVLFTCIFAQRGIAQEAPIDHALARQYFEEAKGVSDQDGGALWKTPVCGPILIIDPETSTAVANQADNEGHLKAADGVYIGAVPPELGVANTALPWAGVEWTALAWPLPEYKSRRVWLMLHECFHRIQSKIGLTTADSQNGHLDSLDGRIWLQMEWRALEHAFWQSGADRKQDISDALYFRAYRRSLFPAAAASENALEMNEGMAEYTGMKLSTSSSQEYAVVAAAWIRSAPVRTPSYGRSFAYTSGPAYGGLLDLASKDWRAGLSPSTDLGELLIHVYSIRVQVPDKAEALRRATRYNGDEVVSIETKREQRHAAQVAAAKKSFVDGAVLVLPVGTGFHYTFNPNAVLAVDDSRTLYEGDVQVTDDWGILKSSEGVLFDREKGRISHVQIPAPTDPSKLPLTGNGWTLPLAPEWKLVPGNRAGDFTIRRSE